MPEEDTSCLLPLRASSVLSRGHGSIGVFCCSVGRTASLTLRFWSVHPVSSLFLRNVLHRQPALLGVFVVPQSQKEVGQAQGAVEGHVRGGALGAWSR